MTPEFLKKLLYEQFWLETLDVKCAYSRLHDDHDGTFKGIISVGFDQMGDAWLFVEDQSPLRFRTWEGGGMSLRTRNALVILAEAIRLDNEETPQFPAAQSDKKANS